MSTIEPFQISCPYCGEVFETNVDASAGSQDYIEDCQVCCQPIEIHVEIDADGAVTAVRVRHQDA